MVIAGKIRAAVQSQDALQHGLLDFPGPRGGCLKRRQLTAHAADLAVSLAQKQMQVDAATDQALVRNFSSQLGSAPDSLGKDGN